MTTKKKVVVELSQFAREEDATRAYDLELAFVADRVEVKLTSAEQFIAGGRLRVAHDCL